MKSLYYYSINYTSIFLGAFALKKILNEVMSQQRKQELELYKFYAWDPSFYQAFFNTIKQVVDRKI